MIVSLDKLNGWVRECSDRRIYCSKGDREISYTDLDIAVVALREYGGVGARTFQLLIQQFGSPQAVFDAIPGEIAALPRMSPEKEEQILRSIDNAELIRKRLTDYESRDIKLTTVYDAYYPESLLEISNPPPMLYYHGNVEITRDNCVAIVGSHEATSEGITEGVRLGAAIGATGTVVVSGLARGIDSAAHIGALKSDGKTIAVLGCGFDEIYPPENRILADNIIVRGLLVSEYSPETKVDSGRLMARNRIIVGLAKSVVVVEITSGTGGTASAMNESKLQGKALFTCFDPNPGGAATNSLGAIQLKHDDDWKMVVRYMV